jgi:hypothetical protein
MYIHVQHMRGLVSPGSVQQITLHHVNSLVNDAEMSDLQRTLMRNIQVFLLGSVSIAPPSLLITTREATKTSPIRNWTRRRHNGHARDGLLLHTPMRAYCCSHTTVICVWV